MEPPKIQAIQLAAAGAPLQSLFSEIINSMTIPADKFTRYCVWAL